ncbi:MAG: sugar phosphate nucleotidyltransferase [Dehalococcoidales bacterium]|nr:sugar phosphate nucleotidyltransferase [Dehalococcoidales bacterium]
MKQAVILAAGEGQRLRPFTVNRPKSMLYIAAKPMLQYVIESLAQNGIRDIVLVVGYRKEQVFDYFGSGEKLGVDITYVTQEKQLGTAHALLQAKEATGEEFLVLHGDNLITAATIAKFIKIKPDAVLVTKVTDPSRYGVVKYYGDKLKKIEEKPKEAGSNTINTGIYSFTKDIYDFIENETGIPDVLNKMVESGRNVSVLETMETRLDIVYPWDILSLNNAVLAQTKGSVAGNIESGVFLKGSVLVGKDTLIRSGTYIVGPVVIGEGCEIGPNVTIRPATSIGDNVIISSFTEIKNSVIGDDVNIAAGSVIQNSVIDKGCIIKDHFTADSGQVEIRVNGDYHPTNVGVMLGEGCSVGSNVFAQPGAIAGNYCQIKAQKTISGRLPDKSLVF